MLQGACGQHAGTLELGHEGRYLDSDETIREGTGRKGSGNGGQSDVTVRTKLIYGNISVADWQSS